MIFRVISVSTIQLSFIFKEQFFICIFIIYIYIDIYIDIDILHNNIIYFILHL